MPPGYLENHGCQKQVRKHSHFIEVQKINEYLGSSRKLGKGVKPRYSNRTVIILIECSNDYQKLYCKLRSGPTYIFLSSRSTPLPFSKSDTAGDIRIFVVVLLSSIDFAYTFTLPFCS